MGKFGQERVWVCLVRRGSGCVWPGEGLGEFGQERVWVSLARLGSSL